MKDNGLKVLVNGGFGYLGANIARYFNKQGLEVLVGTSREELVGVDSEYGTNVYVPYDDERCLLEACDGVDVVIQASGVNAADSVRSPTNAFLINAVGTSRLLEASVAQGVSRFLYISTIHVYSGSLEGVISEESCLRNAHPYAGSHRAAEEIVGWAHRENKIDGVVTRFSNGFGVPASVDANCWMLVVNDLCRQSVEEGRLRLHSNGEQLRNFIPMSDVCSSLYHLSVTIPLSNKVGDVGPINIGGDRSYSVLEIASMVKERSKVILGIDPPVVLGGHDKSAPVVPLEFSQQKIRKLGYTGTSDILREIDSLLEYCFALKNTDSAH